MHVHTCKQMCLFFIKCIHMKPKRMQYNKKKQSFLGNCLLTVTLEHQFRKTSTHQEHNVCIQF